MTEVSRKYQCLQRDPAGLQEVRDNARHLDVIALEAAEFAADRVASSASNEGAASSAHQLSLHSDFTSSLALEVSVDHALAVRNADRAHRAEIRKEEKVYLVALQVATLARVFV